MRLLLPIVLGAAALVAGCTKQQSSSTGDFRGDEKNVAQVVANLADDAARQKQSRVCGELLSARLEKAIAGNLSCPSEVKKAFEDADSAKLEVKDVTITGNTATAKVGTKDRNKTVTRTFKFVKAGGSWRIDSFG